MEEGGVAPRPIGSPLDPHWNYVKLMLPLSSIVQCSNIQYLNHDIHVFTCSPFRFSTIQPSKTNSRQNIPIVKPELSKKRGLNYLFTKARAFQYQPRAKLTTQIPCVHAWALKSPVLGPPFQLHLSVSHCSAHLGTASLSCHGAKSNRTSKANALI